MASPRVSHHRGGVLSIALVGVGVITAGTLATFSFKSSTTVANTSSSSSKVRTQRLVAPVELAVFLNLAGIDAESMAAAGVTATQCDHIFDNANADLLQAERIDQIRLASRALNQAKDRAVHAPKQADADKPTVAAAQTEVDNQKVAAFDFVTSDLGAGAKALLTKTRATSSWHVPAVYRTVDRSDADWLALRGARAAQRYATQNGLEVAPAAAAIIAAADSDPVVVLAKSDSAAHLAAIKTVWAARSHPAP